MSNKMNTVIEAAAKQKWYKPIVKYIADIFSESSDVSSMRIVFVFGSFFVLIMCAILSFKVLALLAVKPEGLSVLAVVLGSIFGGCVALIGALAVNKAWQAKSELNAAAQSETKDENTPAETPKK